MAVTMRAANHPEFRVAQLPVDFKMIEAKLEELYSLSLNALTLVMVLNRWPLTLHSMLTALHPFVDKKVAVVDPRAGLATLGEDQLAHFDAVITSRYQNLDDLRNESLALARQAGGNSWALVVDSDELVEVQSLVRLRAASVAAMDTSALLVPVFNYVGYGRWATTYSFRMFRLNEPIEYHHHIHESISPSLLRHGLHWQYVDAAIQHLDFLEPVSGKRTRYRALLAEAIAKGRDLAFLKTLYAMECLCSGDDARGVQILDEAIDIAADDTQNSRFGGRDDFPISIKAQYLLERGEFDQAVVLFKHLLEKAEPRVAAEAALGLSNIAWSEGDHADALNWIDSSLARWKSPEALMSRAAALAEVGEARLAWQEISNALWLNPMAADPRILANPNSESIFRGRSLLHPNYRGLPALLKTIREKS